MMAGAGVDWIGFRASFADLVRGAGCPGGGPGVIDCDGASGLSGFRGL